MRYLGGLLFLILFATGLSAAAEEKQTSDFLSASLHGYIQPAYDRFEDKTRLLRDATSQLCEKPSAENLEAARSAFSQTVAAWARVEWFRIGPVIVDNNLERVLFYPDRRGTGLRQVQAAIAKKDPTVTDAESLAQKSVAMQGLGALEFLLYGNGNEALETSTETFRCTYAKAIGENLNARAVYFSSTWRSETNVARQWLAPSDSNAWFRHEEEAVVVLVGTLIHGLEAVKDVRINSFLREEQESDRPKSAILWRSRNTMPSITQDLIGLRDLFDISGIESVLPEQFSGLGNSIRFEFEQAIGAAQSLEGPIDELLRDPKSREKIKYLRLAIRQAVAHLDREFLPALGLRVGFSFGDGD